MDPLNPHDPGAPRAISSPTTPPPAGGVPPATPLVSKEERLWGMLAHLSALIGLLGVPFGNIIGPLVVWLIKRNDLPFVDDQGKESLNFQITMTIAGILFICLFVVLIGIPLFIILWLVTFVLTIIGSIKANDGVAYRYPLTWRLVK